MACTPPASASDVFCCSAKRNHWAARAALIAAVLVTIILMNVSKGFIHDSPTSLAGSAAERIVGHLTAFVALLSLQLALICLARRRFSASHHASVKSGNLKALELLAASATDEATKIDLLARAADIIAGKPGCCK